MQSNPTLQCEVHLKNGIRLSSNEELVKTIYNCPEEIEKVILMQGPKKFILPIKSGMRLIFFRNIKMGSPSEIIYNLGFQKTVRGKNVKAILQILPNNEFILTDGED